jgi:hypothetical protein
LKKNCDYSNNTFKETIYTRTFKTIYNNPIYQICKDINDNIIFGTSGDVRFRIFNTGNAQIQNGGTYTDVTSALLSVTSTTKGFRPPVMTGTEKNAISTPVAGLIVFDTTLNKLCVYSGATWETITSL